ncbi:MAG: NAD(P)H-dependent oxidoreductase [Pseudomonadota bacterium]|nr:NAD(P)H-dependent oxidoreductase [Pseudomonadota bacterium]
MTKILVIRSSANAERSVSNQLIDYYLAAQAANDPQAQVTQRDLDRDPVPHVNSATLAGIGRAAPETSSTQGARELSDNLIAEVVAADTLVIGLPMYNFGMPSTLKSWFDYVLRAGTTFRYTAAGPEGLVTGTRAILLVARAGAYSAGGPDFQLGHVRTLLTFMGIADIEVVSAEGLAKGAEAVAAAIAAAHAEIDKLVAVSA